MTTRFCREAGLIGRSLNNHETSASMTDKNIHDAIQAEGCEIFFKSRHLVEPRPSRYVVYLASCPEGPHASIPLLTVDPNLEDPLKFTISRKLLHLMYLLL